MKKRLEEKKVKILFNTKINTIKFKNDKYFLKIKKQFISSDYIFDSQPPLIIKLKKVKNFFNISMVMRFLLKNRF